MANELLVEVLAGNLGMLKNTLQDMTDAELIQRPVPAANNMLWQLGHLINAETMMVNGSAGTTIIELPAGFAERYDKKAAGENDPAKLGSKEDLLNLFSKVRGKTCAWVATLTPADLAKPGPERMRSMCPTVGHLVLLLPAHVAMHLGQLQVLRRKLGKPILF
jgi:hypothetical protein